MKMHRIVREDTNHSEGESEHIPDNLFPFLPLSKQIFMPEIIIKYKSKRTLEALQYLAKYFDYVISTPGSKEKKKNPINLKGVTIIPADNSVDASDLTDIFTGKKHQSKTT